MKTVTITATVDPRPAEAGFNKVAASSVTTANKIKTSMAGVRSALSTTSQSVAGVAKAFLTIELGKRAISGLIELAKQSEYNKKLIDDMNKSTSALAKTISDQMSPAVEFWTDKITVLAQQWDTLLTTGNTDRTKDPEFEKARDLRIKYDELQEASKNLTGLQKEGAEIQLKALQKQIDQQDTLLARLSKGNAIIEARRKLEKELDEQRNKPKEPIVTKPKNTAAEDDFWAKEEEELNAIQETHNRKKELATEIAEFHAEIAQGSAEWVDEQERQGHAMIDSVRNTSKEIAQIERDTLAKRMKMSDQQVSLMANVSEASANGFATAQIMFGKNKKLAIGEAVARGGVAVMNALSIQPWWLGLSQAALATAMTAQTVNQISGAKAAATGADFVTNGPQLMLVGENSGGKERVQVTPLSSPNINGPKGNDGGGGTINFQPIIYMTGNVARDEAYTDRALRSFGRQMQEARRMGYI